MLYLLTKKNKKTPLLFLLLFFVASGVKAQNNSIPPPEHLTIYENKAQLDSFIASYHKIYDGTLQKDLFFGQTVYFSARAQELDSLSCFFAYFAGSTYLEMDSLELALSYLNVALSYEGRLKYQNPIAESYNLIGIAYKQVGMYNEALNSYFKSISIHQVENSVFMTYPLGNISEVYYELGDLEKAIDYTKEAAEYSKKITLKEDYYYNIGFDYTRLSRWYNEANQPDSAKYFLEKTLNIIDSLEWEYLAEKELLFHIYENAARYYLKQGDLGQVKNYLSELEDFENPQFKGEFLLLKGEVAQYQEQYNTLLNIIASPDFYSSDVAIQERMLRFKIDVLNQTNRLPQLVDVYQELDSLIQKKLKTSQKKYSLLANAEQNIRKTQAEVQRLKKERELDQAIIQKQRAYGLAVLALFLALGLVVLIIYWRYQQKAQFNDQLKQEVASKTRDLQVLNEDLELKNEELQRFNFIVSHDLKEPIRSIVSFSKLAELEVGNNQKAKEYLSFVRVAGKQLFQLVEDVSELLRLERTEYQFEEVKLNELVEAIHESIVAAQNGHPVSISYEGPLQSIFSSESALYLIFKNLIENGLKYNEANLRTIEIKGEEDEDAYKFQFKDNGIGIPQEYFDQIFVLFKRLHNRSTYQGSGIGLAISQKIAQKIHGRIQVLESEPGQGTVFLLSIGKRGTN